MTTSPPALDPRSAARQKPRYRSPNGATRTIGGLIFVSRWLQAPLYVGLIVAQLVYVVVFMVELWHLIVNVIQGIDHLEESTIMLAVGSATLSIVLAILAAPEVLAAVQTLRHQPDVQES